MTAIFLLFFGIWFAILKSYKLKIKNNILFYFVLFNLIIWNYLPIPFYCYDLLPQAFDYNLVKREKVYFGGFLIISLSIFLIISSYLLANVFFRAKINPSRHNQVDYTFFASALLLAVSLIILFQYLKVVGVKNIALFEYITGFQGIPVAKIRSLMTSEFPGKYHWYYFGMRDFLFASCFMGYFWYKKNKTKIRFLIFLLILSTSLFSSLMATEKGPIFQIIIGLILCSYLSNKNWKISPKKFVFLIMFIFCMLFCTFFFFVTKDIPRLIEAVVFRLCGQVMGFFMVLDAVPMNIPFQGGLTLPNPLGIFGFETPDLNSTLVYLYGLQESKPEASVMTVTSFFGSEAYVNWGIFGVIIVSVCLGIYIKCLDFFFKKATQSIFLQGFYIWSILNISKISWSGFSILIFDIPFILLCTLCCLSHKFLIVNRRILKCAA